MGQAISLLRIWIFAALVGFITGGATLGFRIAISALQTLFYGADDVALASTAAGLPWYLIIALPVCGGLAVGLILHHFTQDAKPRTLAQVIEGAALHNGRVETRAGFGATLASLVTLSTGGSTGREGPAIQLGATLSSVLAGWFKMTPTEARTMLGCAAAAAVAASFNAPLAGAVFALEVILRRYAISAIGPILLSAVIGAIISRAYFGNFTEFVLPAHGADFYVELPAFLILGLICACAATILIRAIFWAEDLADGWQARLKIPRYLRPAGAGFLLGIIALQFPHIIGVGYETVFNALSGKLVLQTALIFALVKAIAVVITLAGRMGGGVFSPSLMIGALTGLAFGWIATAIFPSVEGEQTLYALAGMGAVSAAVLGAPLSTILIVIELTGDWQAGLAVMLSVAVASNLTNRWVKRSFFLTQLDRRGVMLADGAQNYLMDTIEIVPLIRPKSAMSKAMIERAWKEIEAGEYLTPRASLAKALARFEENAQKPIPILKHQGSEKNSEFLGKLYYVDVLRAYNKALADHAANEHR